MPAVKEWNVSRIAGFGAVAGFVKAAFEVPALWALGGEGQALAVVALLGGGLAGAVIFSLVTLARNKFHNGP